MPSRWAPVAKGTVVMINTPFEDGQKGQHDELPIQEMSQNSHTSRKCLRSRATESRGPLSVKKSDKARISQPSDDVSYGNSWQDVGESDATTTRPAPGVRTKEQAR